jgi:hypothetical protein
MASYPLFNAVVLAILLNSCRAVQDDTDKSRKVIEVSSSCVAQPKGNGCK